MKKIFLTFVAAACMLGSCSDDSNTAESTIQDRISISTDEVTVGPDGGTSQIQISSSGDWRLSGVCDWAHPSAVSGKDGQTLTFTVDPNDTDSNREATFKFFTGGAVTTVKIVSEVGHGLKLLSDKEMTCARVAGSLSVKLRTNIENLTTAFSDGGAEWITFDQRTDVFGKTILNFSVSENKTYDNRSSVVTISGLDMSVSVKVIQRRLDAIFLDKSSFDVDPVGGTISVAFDANFDQTVEIPARYAGWIHRATDQKSTFGLTKRTETFRIDATKALRNGTIILKNADGSCSASVTIKQSGTEHYYVTIPDANFRKYLIDNNFISETEDSRFEITYDGLEATSFNCNNKQIKSLEGIASFTKLTSLNCRSNPVEFIPLGNLKMTTLEIGNTYTKIPLVTIIGTNLTSVNAAYHYMQAIDVSECPSLAMLDISYCYSLKTLYLKTGQTIATIKDPYAGNSVGGYTKVYK